MSSSNDNETLPIVSPEEIRAIYDQGPEAVISVFGKLLLTVSDQAKQIESLTALVAELRSRLNKDSHNSSKPPSSDGLRKKPKPKSQRKKTGRRSGGQPGHQGATLRQSDNPDHFADHAPSICSGCGASLDFAASTDSKGAT